MLSLVTVAPVRAPGGRTERRRWGFQTQPPCHLGFAPDPAGPPSASEGTERV